MDMFDNVVLCKDCNKKMQKVSVARNGFVIRALQCPQCNQKIFHPADIEEYRRFETLKSRAFHVKLRMVGNSYTVSIPREIVSFIKETEEIHDKMRSAMHKEMREMVTMALEQAGKISLMFGKEINGAKEENKRKEMKIAD